MESLFFSIYNDVPFVMICICGMSSTADYVGESATFPCQCQTVYSPVGIDSGANQLQVQARWVLFSQSGHLLSAPSIDIPCLINLDEARAIGQVELLIVASIV